MDKLKPCCEECVNYNTLVIGINYIQLRDFCVEHQCHVNPKSNACKDFYLLKKRNRRAGNE